MNTHAQRPWYREPWPWFLMAGPFIVIVAAAVTIWLAVTTSDGLVTEDYYREGLTINRLLAREEAARTLGISVTMEVVDGAVRINYRSRESAPPARLRLTYAHPSRGGMDENLLLTGVDGVYTARLPVSAAARWLVFIEDESAQWRLSGALKTRPGARITLPSNDSVDESTTH